MRTGLRISSLVPSGLVVESVSDLPDSIILAVRSPASAAKCPSCGSISGRIHSRYTRQVADLPSAGRKVRLRVITRRFVCGVPHCRRKIFAERFGDSLPVRARRTARLECIVHHFGLALGGRPAASFARRLMVPVSNDTLLRVVRRRTCPRTEPLIVAGIDDWAFRKNHRYGTIVCDLERRQWSRCCPIARLPPCALGFPSILSIKVVSRDRGGGYGEAAPKTLPDAPPGPRSMASDRDASASFLGAVRRSMRLIHAAIGTTTINPELLTCAERLQYQGYLRRQEVNAAIMTHVKDGVHIKEIVRRTGHSRQLVRQVSRGQSTDIFHTRQSTLDPHLPLLDAQWADGCRNGTELWRRLQVQGFQGSSRVVSEWRTRRQRAEKATDQQLQKVPPARTISRLMTTSRDHLSKADTVTIAAIEAHVPTLVEARTLIERFQVIVRTSSSPISNHGSTPPTAA